MSPTLTLVLPAYNEASRLPRTIKLLGDALAQGAFGPLTVTEILVVNDGSTDNTAAVVELSRKELPLLRLVNVTPNRGKGFAVRRGLKEASADYILIADADSATPWVMAKVLADAALQANVPFVIGSRGLKTSDIVVRQSFAREYMGRTFNLLVRLITGLSFKDTQCGFKLLKSTEAKTLLPLLQVDRFAWDVEFLMRAERANFKAVEIPITWEHQDASRVHPIRDSLEMLWRLIQLRLRISLGG